MNYFELFEMPVSLKVDPEELSAKYFALQRKYHPDFFSNAGETEQSEMLEASSQVNKAYKTFRDPEETIFYVLQLRGLIDEEEKYSLPPSFLAEMMELNEDLSTVDDSSMEEVETKISQLENQLYAEVQPVIEYFNNDNTTDAQLLLVKEYYFKKKYLKRILERLQGMRNIASQ